MNGRHLFLGGVLLVAAFAAWLRPAQRVPALEPLPLSSMGLGAREGGVERLPRKAHDERLVVYVAGEVAHPGVYRVLANERVEAALHAAGGALPNADLVAVNLAEPLKDGEEIAVPARGARERGMPRGGGGRPSSRLRSRAYAKTSLGAVNINTADEEELRALPGVGASLAMRIIAYRRANGAFRSSEELRDVNGVSDAKFDRMLPHIVL
jgi:competence protein ComEA